MNLSKKSILLALSPLFLNSAHAADQQVGAGSLLQQAQPVKPPAAVPTITGLRILQSNGSQLPASAPFLVTAIHISGNTQFDVATLHALVADVEGQRLNLEQLGQAVDRITNFYLNHGYPLARAFVPAQTIEGGVVEVTVLEARYGKITLNNRSRVNNLLLETTLSPLKSGQPIEQTGLDHSLLLLSDIPGVTTTAVLTPGATVGTSDLEIGTETPQPYTASTALDTFGNRYTGRARWGGALNVLDPLHQGDVLSVNVLTSGSGMAYGRLAYEAQLGGEALGLGTRIGGALSALHYKLGDTLAAADGHGTAQTASLWIKHPFVRTREANLSGQFQYDHKQLDDDIDVSAPVQTRRHLDSSTATLTGDWRDGWLAAANGEASNVNSWSLGWEIGQVHFDNAAAQAADAATAATQGAFQKWTLAANRQQNLGPADAASFSFSGQWSNTNLDASEKMAAGGPYTVRAYDMGVVSGDSGALASVELRHELGWHWQGQMQAIAFVDSEHVKVNQTSWTTGANAATLSGMGLGLNWYGPQLWSAKVTLATTLGAAPGLVGASKSARAWAELDKAF